MAAIALIAVCGGCATSQMETLAPEPREPSPAAPPEPEAGSSPAGTESRIDFATEIRPILVERCSPCHFEGGKMYARLPFDDPATLPKAGPGLLRRIKDEEENALIRRFLEEAAAAPSPAPAASSSD